MNNIYVNLVYYCFDIMQTEQAEQYTIAVQHATELGLKRSVTLGWQVDSGFLAKLRKLTTAGPVSLEVDTQFLFKDQLNTAPVKGISDSGLRLHFWNQIEHPNQDIKEGYYLELSEEFKTLLSTRHACGFCGAQYDDKGQGYCLKCLGSEALAEENLPLLQLVPINGKRLKKLPPELKAEIMPLYIERQTVMQKEKADKLRLAALADYQDKLERITIKRDGSLWLLDNGVNTDNCIYYDHTKTFCFGWKHALSEVVKQQLKEKLKDFPFKYELK